MDRGVAVRNVLIYTLAANVSVALAKVGYGHFTNSISITSDGFHSFFDGTSNIVGLVGIWIASRPPDRNHPYGHKKYETLFTMAIASMLFFTCYEILKRVYHSFHEGHRTVVTEMSFVIMIVTIAVNISVMLYELKRGRELQSEFLIADAKHTKSDILTSFSVIIGLIFSRLGYQQADAIIGMIIVALIAKIGYEILKAASDVLVDTVCIDTFDVEAVVAGIEGVRGC
ncbi:MAG TPA: cation diffusion facilitator family transporter, partial [Thermodesulfovibrionales bacterium]|nr:cation diffusion facilitator family transporter [Thermodesulfovibrionales bacterium]